WKRRVPNRGSRSGSLGFLREALTVGAERRLRHYLQPLETDFPTASLARSERVRIPVKSTKRFIDLIETPTLDAREEELLLPLHRLGPDVRRMKAIQCQLPCSFLKREFARLVELAKAFHRSFTVLLQPGLDPGPLFR